MNRRGDQRARRGRRRGPHARAVVRAAALAAAVSVLGACAVPEVAGTRSPATPAHRDLVAGVVVDVVDGDTVKVQLAESTDSAQGVPPAPTGAGAPDADQTVTVRLIGIDTPETRHPGKPVECLGPEATARAVELAAGQQVDLEGDPTQDDTDRYGRALAYVWLDDQRMLNEMLVSEGLAREYTYDRAYLHQDRMVAAQRAAQEGHLGLWAPGACDEAG